MDVREQLRAAPPGPAPSVDDARRTYQRGRRRVMRRRAAGAGATLAAVLVAVVVAVPFGTPGSIRVEDGPAGPPPADRGPDGGPTEDPGGVGEQGTVQVGEVVLTIPDGVSLERVVSGGEPCYSEAIGPTLVVMDSIVPDTQRDCPEGAVADTSVVAVPASGVPPAYLPGHADVEGTADVTDVDLLGTTGVVERWSLSDGTLVDTYLFTELDLYLTVIAPDLMPGFAEELLASATRAGATTDGDDATGSDGERTGAPPLDDEASTEDRQSPPEGPVDLELVDVRVGTHEGFDRVVFVFAGDGQVGWFTNLDDRAIEDGSGHEVDVAGGAVLTVALNAMAFPPDLPGPTVDWNGVRIPAPAGSGVLTEVVGSIWFEAQQQVFIGLDETVAYRVERLDDPQRLVIDLIHP
ncbi:AMIN-like domain-containing (lipo)protein [Nitriliruptor alkaliphilus]|uniref:AMIN-like domain-containing (lipo)protein n=1 Tax=Nitriliruptor alkaliphilus TaxID=427918 RepID=UPI00069720CD|nr:hypothetical protein [Nitriliruptor alkaliphilus]